MDGNLSVSIAFIFVERPFANILNSRRYTFARNAVLQPTSYEWRIRGHMVSGWKKIDRLFSAASPLETTGSVQVTALFARCFTSATRIALAAICSHSAQLCWE